MDKIVIPNKTIEVISEDKIVDKQKACVYVDTTYRTTYERALILKNIEEYEKRIAEITIQLNDAQNTLSTWQNLLKECDEKI